MAEPAVEVTDLCRDFGELRALDEVSFSVEAGENFGLLGPNGGGKSTLFRILSTLLPPTSGTARVFSREVVREGGDVRGSIGVVFQSASLDKKLTVTENLRYAGHLFGLKGQGLERRIGELLDRFAMADRAGDLVETLSGGLARRVEIAKGMLHVPKLLLLDEPSTGLDPGARRDLWSQLDDIRKNDGVTILVTTHILEEADGCDRLALLDRGKLVALGTPDELKNEIAGQVITLETDDDADALSGEIEQRFELKGRVVDGAVRLEQDNAPELAQRLFAELGDRMKSVTIGKPTLEDVFLDRTGHSLWADR